MKIFRGDLQYPLMRKNFQNIGCSKSGIDIISSKLQNHTIFFENISLAKALVLKQEMLVSGGDAALSESAIKGDSKKQDIYLTGSKRVFKRVATRLSEQGSWLNEERKVLENLLYSTTQKMLFKVKERKFMSDKTYIMGILNITPDSFSDGGKYDNLESALVKAMELEEQGADIIDIGGESSRPGAKEVSLEEEIHRVIPLIKKIREESKIPISIDTYKPEVARQAMEAGADIINYIKGYSIDSKMLDVVEEHECPFVLMHMRGTPENMQQKTDYNALMGDMISEITPVYDKLMDLLGNPGKIIIDPGIGFGKTVEDNWKIIKELQTLKVMGSPVLLGASRKSFIGKTFSIDNMHERDIITSFISQFAIQSGVNFIRVHNVELHKKLIETMIYMGVCDDRV